MYLSGAFSPTPGCRKLNLMKLLNATAGTLPEKASGTWLCAHKTLISGAPIEQKTAILKDPNNL